MQAAKHFQKVNMIKHAASCFFTGAQFKQAGELFEKVDCLGQAAECWLFDQQPLRAAKLFEKANLIAKAIDCYENAGAWEQLLNCLSKHKDYFKQEERESLVNKYVPVAINSMYRMYAEGAEGVEDEENKGKMQEMKIRLKYQKQVDMI